MINSPQRLILPVCSGAVSRIMSANQGRDRVLQRPRHVNSIEHTCPSLMRGIDYLKDPRYNKGMAFTLEERIKLGIHGLIPPRFKTQEEQANLCLVNVERFQEPINKYIFLMSLQDRNEKLFFKVLSDNVEEMMPIVYTPTVGLACQKFGLIYRRPRGLFITIHDKGHVYDVLKNWPEPDVRCIVVTDGERILGLGDLGAYGMGIPVGKLALYVALAGIKPEHCLPIVLDVGTNTQKNLDDPLYIGLRQTRTTGKEYDDFIDEFMEAVVHRYGQDTLVQFEDFGNQNAFRMLEKYRNKYCTFNDDIQGTASVAVAGLIAAMRITKKKLSENIILFQGAGEASTGIAALCVMAMQEEGLNLEEAKKRIFLVDSRGLIVKNRPEGGVVGHKVPWAQDHKPMKDLEEIVREIKPSIIIGAAAIPRVFTPQLIKDMASFNERPVIFALSNPTSKAECTAEEAYVHSEGRAVFASGSPFDVVNFNGKEFHPGQGNNAYIFPGVGLGILCCGIHHVSDYVFLKAAQTLASLVTNEDLGKGRVYPPLSNILECSVKIAVVIAENAYLKGTASTYPEPKDKEEFIRSQLYNHSYFNAVPEIYEWPEEHHF